MSDSDNYSLIEGEFKTFNIRRITLADHDNVWAHVKEHFLHGEVTSKTLGVTEDYTNEFEQITRAVLWQNYSFLAEEKDSKEIAGLRLSFVEKRDDNIFKDIQIEARQTKVILQLFAELDALAKVYETYGVEEYVYFFVASTAPNFAGQGLAKEFYRRSLRFLKAEGHKICKVFTSSPYSRAATKSNGFKEMGRVDYENLKDSEGNPIFDSSELSPEHFALVKVFNLDELQV